jgi:hypothetical protein
MSSLGMWLKDDIANILKGIAQTTPFMYADKCPEEREAFQIGYMAALCAVGTSLGISNALPPIREMKVRDATTSHLLR